MKSVWKFALGQDTTTVELPALARIVHVGMQGGLAFLWAEVPLEVGGPPLPMEQRIFDVHGTGHAIPDGSVHVGTFFEPPFVWHLYEQR